MLECAVNLAEGRDESRLSAFARAAGSALLDLHADTYHHRSVLTLAGAGVERAVRALVEAAVGTLDLVGHDGVHPRLGVVDVVPFAPLGAAGLREDELSEALAARELLARFVGEELGVPCFVYGPERSLPEVRRSAFVTLRPDYGPVAPHPSAGACCVGARPLLVAYNLVLSSADLELGRAVATEVRSADLRALAFPIGAEVQVSCNLVAPWRLGPAAAYDRISALAEIGRAELVGLIPEAVLGEVPRRRFGELGLDESATVEARLAEAGRGG